jgi:hypothetical protein
MDKQKRNIRIILGLSLSIAFIWFAFGFVRYTALLTYWGEEMTNYGYWLAPENENVLGLEIVIKYTGQVVGVYSEGTDEPEYFLILKTPERNEISISLPTQIVVNSAMIVSNSASGKPTIETLDCNMCVLSRLTGSEGKEISLDVVRYTKKSPISYIKRLIIYED